MLTSATPFTCESRWASRVTADLSRSQTERNAIRPTPFGRDGKGMPAARDAFA